MGVSTAEEHVESADKQAALLPVMSVQLAKAGTQSSVSIKSSRFFPFKKMGCPMACEPKPTLIPSGILVSKGFSALTFASDGSETHMYFSYCLSVMSWLYVLL